MHYDIPSSGKITDGKNFSVVLYYTKWHLNDCEGHEKANSCWTITNKQTIEQTENWLLTKPHPVSKTLNKISF
jgi:hypothetical protein